MRMFAVSGTGLEDCDPIETNCKWAECRMCFNSQELLVNVSTRALRSSTSEVVMPSLSGVHYLLKWCYLKHLIYRVIHHFHYNIYIYIILNA